MPYDQWDRLNESPFVPLEIRNSAEGRFRVTQVGVDAAHKLTRQTWENNAGYRQTFKRAEFDKRSFTAIGDTILQSPRHVENGTITEIDGRFYQLLAADYEINLDRLVKDALVDLDRHIPCQLFHSSQEVAAFSVGPVEFRPRAAWIERYVTDPLVLTYVRKVESGELRIGELRSQSSARPAERELFTASVIARWLGGFEWIATVAMVGHEVNQSHHKASIIVGLAIDVVGLRFQLDQARRFTKAGRQHLFAEDRLATTKDGAFVHGWGAEMAGLGSAPGALSAKMAAERPFFDAAGKLLGIYLESRQTGPAPHLVERWANALYWMGEARREASDFMAVVNYGCAADGLSGAGGVAKVMVAFAQAALNPKAEPAFNEAVATAVHRVYREGRNKLAHGESSGLFEDLAEIRSIGDTLLVSLFDVATLELAKALEQRPQVFEVDEKAAYRALLARLATP
ncbi:hypothetical protein FJ420_31040 [Mesorhizobium sp. B3-1-3]|nr:hypothetical protein FJ420_31040 [Mesorhizobium sp. B3-1-3]TPI68140.1 hypothetical protein FJ424_08405 [Mesorhizobium sp. B3-1-8]